MSSPFFPPPGVLHHPIFAMLPEKRLKHMHQERYPRNLCVRSASHLDILWCGVCLGCRYSIVRERCAVGCCWDTVSQQGLLWRMKRSWLDWLPRLLWRWRMLRSIGLLKDVLRLWDTSLLPWEMESYSSTSKGASSMKIQRHIRCASCSKERLGRGRPLRHSCAYRHNTFSGKKK